MWTMIHYTKAGLYNHHDGAMHNNEYCIMRGGRIRSPLPSNGSTSNSGPGLRFLAMGANGTMDQTTVSQATSNNK